MYSCFAIGGGGEGEADGGGGEGEADGGGGTDGGGDGDVLHSIGQPWERVAVSGTFPGAPGASSGSATVWPGHKVLYGSVHP